jgi:hypothetical protein
MKVLRILMIALVAITATQISKAQIIKVDPIVFHDFTLHPSDFYGTFPETIVQGQMIYYLQGRYDKHGVPRLHFQSKSTPFMGESGAVYIYHDVVAQGDAWMQPTYEVAQSYTYEMMFIGQYKIHLLGGGKLDSGRTQIIIELDESGNAIVKKYVNYF